MEEDAAMSLLNMKPYALFKHGWIHDTPPCVPCFLPANLLRGGRRAEKSTTLIVGNRVNKIHKDIRQPFLRRYQRGWVSNDMHFLIDSFTILSIAIDWPQ